MRSAALDPRAIVERVAATRAAVGPAPWVVGYDANGIQELIAASGRPITMRGASEVILDFDRWARDERRAVFAGGGRGLLLAASEPAARDLAGALVDEFRRRTRGGVMAACAVPLGAPGTAEALSLRWLRHRLDLEKDAALPPAGQLPEAKEDECAYCRGFRGTTPRRREDVDELVCVRCDAMLAEGRRAGLARGERFGEMSTSIADIAERDRIAVISADGNNLGALFDSLRGLAEIAAASAAVAAIFQRAQETALDTVPERQRVPLLSGGDDLRAFVPPSALLRYLETLVATVERESAAIGARLDGALSPAAAARVRGIGIGAGAVVANVYVPAWRLVEHARALERAAKSRGAARELRSAVDFAVLTNEDAIGAAPVRPEHDLRPLSPCTPAWRAAIEAARALGRIPSAQLAALAADGALDDPERAAEHANAHRYQVARSPAWQRWHEARGVDWRDRDAVIAHRPDRGMLELARLTALAEPAS